MNKNTTILIIVLLLILIYSSYKKTQKSKNPEALNPNKLIPGPIVHENLSNEQIEKIKIIQTTFLDVVPISLEETIINFKRDRNPDNEIGIWLNMAYAYEKFISKDPQITLEKKSEVFKLILSRSMMDENKVRTQSECKFLSENEINEIFKYYTLESKPLIIE